MSKQIPKYPSCYVCGNQNPVGLNLTFYEEKDHVKTKFTPKPDWCGYPNIVHGGIIAAIFDEGLGWAGYPQFKEYYLSLEVSVRYLKRMLADNEYTFIGRMLKSRGNFYFSEGEIIDKDGEIYAVGTGKYVIKTDNNHD